MNAAPGSTRAVLGEALAAGVLALLVYLTLGQQTLYGDAMTFLRMLREGATQYERHVLYLPALHAWQGLLAPLGATVYQSALLASQVGAALGVAFVFAAARGHGLPRGCAWFTAGAFATCPGPLFFGTVVELHGPFMATVGLAWLLGALLLRRPTVWSALALAVGTTAATGMHSSGALLPAPILGALLWNAWPQKTAASFARRVGVAVLAGVAHGALVLALTGGVGQFAFVRKMAPVSIGMESHLLEVVTWEWVWPFLPFSVLFVLGLRAAAWRPLTVVVLLSVLLYLLPSYLVLAMWREYGAYLIPLVFPAAAIAVSVLPRGASALALAVAGTVAVMHVIDHDRPERPREYAAGARELAGGRVLRVLGGDETDIEAGFVSLPDVDFILLTLPPFIDTEGPAARLALGAGLDAMLQRGEAVLLSRGTATRLADQGTVAVFPPAGEILPFLEARYDLREVRVRGFSGWEVLARR